MKTSVLLVVTALAAVVFAGVCRASKDMSMETLPAATTIASTCQAAHNVDSRVSQSFCNTQLNAQPRAVYADTSGHAEAAAAAGADNAVAAREETQRALERLDEGDEQEQDQDPAVYRRALERCDRLYGMVKETYAAARQLIAAQRYGEVERELATVATIARSCDYGFTLTRRAGASPFLRYSKDNAQIALLIVAITNLVK